MIKVDEKGGGAVFSVRISPGAAKTRIIGEHDGALKVSVSAAPEKGKANKALVEFLSALLGVAKSDLEIVSGHASRTKRVSVRGFTPEALRAKIAPHVGG